MNATTLQFALSPVNERMDNERRSGPPDRREHDDRQSSVSTAWNDPRFIVQLVVLLLSILGWVVVSQSRTVTLEAAAQNLNEKASKIEGQLNTIVASVQATSLETRSLQAELAARGREMQNLKDEMQMLEARIISMEKGLARAEAKSP